MSAIPAHGEISSAIDRGAEAVQDEVDRALSLPRALIEASLRAGSALLGFAGQCAHAETEFFERLSACRDCDEARALHARFVAAMIGEGGRELTELMAVARENVALIADAAGPAPTIRPAS
jgi:hypothetical protein